MPVQGPQDVVRLGNDGHPKATQVLRLAGSRTGIVLSAVLSFFNPECLILDGHLAETDAFVAGLRSAIYEHVLPMITDSLEISTSEVGPLAGVMGGAKAVLDAIYSPGSVAVRSSVSIEHLRTLTPKF